MANYNSIAKHFDVITKMMTDYTKEAKTMQAIFKAHNVATVFDMACGTGSHVIELSKLGYQCTGADISEGMLQVAKEKADQIGLDIDFIQADMKSFKVNKKFDAILGLYAMGYLVDIEDLKEAFNNVRDAIRTGGVFYFNTLNASFENESNGPSLLNRPIFYFDIPANDHKLKIVRFNNTVYKGETQEWTSTYFIDEGQGVKMEVMHQVYRLHTKEGLEELLNQYGFKLIDVSYSDVPTFKKWDMFVVAVAV